MQSTSTRVMAIVAGLAALILVVVTPSGPSSADTATPYTTKASVGAHVDAAPGTPLTGLSHGDVVTIRVDEGGGQTLSGIQVRLCRDLPGGIAGTNAFSSDGAGNCLGVDDPPVPPVPNAWVSVQQKIPGDTFVQTTITLSTGTWTWTTAQGNPRTMTCDANNPCDLWVRHQGSLAGGNAFVHYDLQFGAGSTTSTTAATTSTTGATTSTTGATTSTSTPTSTSTSTTAPTSTSTSTTSTTAPTSTSTSTTAPTSTSTSTTVASTTSTTGGSTTSTTSASSTSTSTSTTVAPSSTTSTTEDPGSTSTTSTTLPDGTTVTPTVPAGGTIEVESNGWAPSSEVAATLNSDPVDLGVQIADAAGTLTATYTVPASVPAGEHTLVLTGLDATGAARTVTAGVTVTAQESTTTTDGTATTSTTSPSGGEIPRTGVQTVRQFAAAVLFLCAGGLLVSGSRQRMLRLREPR